MSGPSLARPPGVLLKTFCPSLRSDRTGKSPLPLTPFGDTFGTRVSLHPGRPVRSLTGSEGRLGPLQRSSRWGGGSSRGGVCVGSRPRVVGSTLGGTDTDLWSMDFPRTTSSREGVSLPGWDLLFQGRDSRTHTWEGSLSFVPVMTSLHLESYRIKLTRRSVRNEIICWDFESV